MQFATLALTALASAQAALAASGSAEFGALAIDSGTGLQYSSIIAEGDDLYFGHGPAAQAANVTNCGFLQFKDGTYAYVDTNGYFKKGPRGDAIPGFKIANGSLKYNNSDLFGVPAGNQYRVSSKPNGNGSTGILIRPLNVAHPDNAVPDYTPDGKDCTATGPPACINKRDHEELDAAEPDSPSYVITREFEELDAAKPDSPSYIIERDQNTAQPDLPSVSSENRAAQLGSHASLSFGAAAAVAVLLL